MMLKHIFNKWESEITDECHCQIGGWMLCHHFFKFNIQVFFPWFEHWACICQECVRTLIHKSECQRAPVVQWKMHWAFYSIIVLNIFPFWTDLIEICWNSTEQKEVTLSYYAQYYNRPDW